MYFSNLSGINMLDFQEIPDISDGKYSEIALESIEQYEIVNLALMRLIRDGIGIATAYLDEVEEDREYRSYIDRYNAQKEMYEFLLDQVGHEIKAEFNGNCLFLYEVD